MTLQKNKIKFVFNSTKVLHGGIKSLMGAWRRKKGNRTINNNKKKTKTYSKKKSKKLKQIPEV